MLLAHPRELQCSGGGSRENEVGIGQTATLKPADGLDHRELNSQHSDMCVCVCVSHICISLTTGDSDKNPIPGCRASQPLSTAARTRRLASRKACGPLSPRWAIRSAVRHAIDEASSSAVATTASAPSACTPRVIRAAISPLVATRTRRNIAPRSSRLERGGTYCC
jgi:hypothetical protein